MATFDKWIGGITSEESVRDAALHSLRSRLEALEHYLPLAAERPDEDVEYVHELRVFTRRSIAALRLYKELLPKKRTKWLLKTLRKIRRAAGTARDLDVLAASHPAKTGKGSHALLVRIRKRRVAAQSPIVAIHQKLRRSDRLHRRIEGLLDSVATTTSFPAEDAFGPWAASKLRKAVKRFFKASPSDHQDLETLHRFRIRGKELRYVIELLAPAFPAELRQELYPAIKEFQDQLGQIHDCVVASDRFGKWASQAKSKKEKTRLKELLEWERDRLEALLGEFSDSWTAESQTQLRDAFDRLLASPNRETS